MELEVLQANFKSDLIDGLTNSERLEEILSYAEISLLNKSDIAKTHEELLQELTENWGKLDRDLKFYTAMGLVGRNNVRRFSSLMHVFNSESSIDQNIVNAMSLFETLEQVDIKSDSEKETIEDIREQNDQLLNSIVSGVDSLGLIDDLCNYLLNKIDKPISENGIQRESYEDFIDSVMCFAHREVGLF